jgi:hypothetical protein
MVKSYSLEYNFTYSLEDALTVSLAISDATEMFN